MDKLIDFFSNNIDKFFTLLSVIIGGTMTYISTSSIEKKKNKRHAQKENLEQIILPYCNCLELTIDNLNQICDKRKNFSSDKIFEEWLSSLKKPLEYLTAYKRIYLSKNSMNNLIQYEKMLSNFEIVIHQEYEKFLCTYKNYLEKKLLKFPNVENSMFITFSTNNQIKVMIKSIILNKSEISLLDTVTRVDFIHNDDSDNYRTTNISITPENKYNFGAINCGVMSLDDVADQDKLIYILLDFIYHNIKDEKETLTNLINDTSSSALLLDILYTIKNMRNKLVKEIDKIANC